MPTEKPQYKGRVEDIDDDQKSEFSEGLKSKLLSIYPHVQGSETFLDDEFVGPAGAFVNALLVAARWAKLEKIRQRRDVNKSQIMAELNDIGGLLEKVSKKLTRLSPEVDRLLGSNANPLGVVDEINKLVENVYQAKLSAKRLEKSQKPIEKDHSIAVELAIRLLPVLESYDIPTTASASKDLGTQSLAVEILKLIGDEIKIVHELTTWREVLREAKETRKKEKISRSPLPRGELDAGLSSEDKAIFNELAKNTRDRLG